MVGRFRSVTPLLALIARMSAEVHGQGYNRYEAQYGEPVDVSFDDLANTPSLRRPGGPDPRQPRDVELQPRR